MTRRTRIPQAERSRLMATLIAKGATPEEAAREVEEALDFTGNLQLRRYEMEAAARGAMLTGVTRPHFVGVAVMAAVEIIEEMAEWMSQNGSLDDFPRMAGMSRLARMVGEARKGGG